MVLAWLGWLLASVALFGGATDDVHVLRVPYRNQLDGSPYAQANCGPTSLAMVLGYYDVEADTWDLRVRSMKVQRSWVDDEGGYSHRYGVFVYNLAHVAEEHGFEVVGLWEHEGRRLDRLRRWEPADVRRQLALGRPVIVQVEYRALPGNAGSSYMNDHYVVVHGMRGDELVYSDPLGRDGRGPDERISAEVLGRAMQRASSPGAAFAIRKR